MKTQQKNCEECCTVMQNFEHKASSALTRKHSPHPVSLFGNPNRESQIWVLVMHGAYRSSIRKETWIPVCCLSKIIFVLAIQGIINSHAKYLPDSVFLVRNSAQKQNYCYFKWYINWRPGLPLWHETSHTAPLPQLFHLLNWNAKICLLTGVLWRLIN